MKANELRIGNYITLPSKGTVYQISSGHDIEEIEGSGDAKEIRITPEWLERFGFQKTSHFGYGGKPMTFSAPEIKRKALYHTGTFYWMNKELNIEFTNEHGHYACIDFLKIKYVHQLQNLYFALCGEELQLTSKKQAAD